MLQRVQCFLLLGVMASVSLHAQAPRRPPSVVGPSGSRVVSPAVVATSITKQRQNGDGELELLVLWRGSPGWFLESGKDGRSGSVTWGGRASGRPGDSRETVDHQVFLGGLALHLQFNMQEQTARVQDIEVSLQNANVILVDRVDSREDLTVVRNAMGRSTDIGRFPSLRRQRAWWGKAGRGDPLQISKARQKTGSEPALSSSLPPAHQRSFVVFVPNLPAGINWTGATPKGGEGGETPMETPPEIPPLPACRTSGKKGGALPSCPFPLDRRGLAGLLRTSNGVATR